ncbi:MAG: RNA polymerase factor sigma-54 [Clostridiales Family XIII bacterium]|jgi:RNA polymerase sigma-54 factor|nr:RNA polymerase factor sigma-54 [Clostridiales Family XIII bacterium]
MEMGININLEQRQTMVMTPELIQAIKLLQYNTQELVEYIEEQLLTNPVLEVDSEAEDEEISEKEIEKDAYESESISHNTESDKDDFDWQEYIREREIDDISYSQTDWVDTHSHSDFSFLYENNAYEDLTLSDHLLSQMFVADPQRYDLLVASYIIESLDLNGYMTQSVIEIAEQLDADIPTVEKAVALIQGFEPAGVCARDLPECLLLQLHRLGITDEIVVRIVKEHLADLASNKIALIAKTVGVNIHRVQEIADVIKTLEPKPGSPFGKVSDTRYILPDVIVEKVEDSYVVSINSINSPRLYISSYYRHMLGKSAKDSQISKFLRDRLNSAIWLIKCIEQRNQTIYNVVDAIVRYQQDFFKYGEKKIKPLTLKKVAVEVGVHESTVSRAICGKYLQSPRGVFELKYFFPGGFSCESGEEYASESIKARIRELIVAENTDSPLSDQCIAMMLNNDSIEISRRTVAKYRDVMGIPASNKRKRYK